LPEVLLFTIPFIIIVNEELAATSPPVGTLKDILVAVFVKLPIAAPFIVPPVMPESVNPAGKVMTTALPTEIAEFASVVVFALKV